MSEQTTGLEIAVIGMAGRFPRAANIEEFWDNLINGVECITFFSAEELEGTGLAPEVLRDPNYVKAKGVLEDIEYFDADFFGYSPREARFMDPQVRILHECCWEALENAGYNPDTYAGAIGLYSGSIYNMVWLQHLLSSITNPSEQIWLGSLNLRDFLSTRVSYKLNLRGASITVQTACSTSLVSIHLACQSLLSGECDMALAGGVSILLPQKNGYLYQDGMINSNDGHCRPFDAEAGGTNMGDGVGMVVLKPLETATGDRDFIHALVKGSAMNNDGSRKVGFTAPSVAGETEVIKAALHMAEVEAETVGYIEAHGTATKLGDPVEIEALNAAFESENTGFCRIGSLKSNMGHLDAAAGVAGFIKAVLTLKHGQIPPSLHYTQPNPKIDFQKSPFIVADKAREWETNGHPRRAGVSAFGIGGTNVHIILEEFHHPPRRESQAREHHIFPLSAKDEKVLWQMAKNLGEFLKARPHTDIGDAAYTLQVGRKAFQHKLLVVADNNETLAETLLSRDPDICHYVEGTQKSPPVFFMFPGQGAQYINMGIGLYDSEPVFKRELDRCFDSLLTITGYNFREILFPSGEEQGSGDGTQPDLNQTQWTQPLILSFEYALAKLLISWNIHPQAMIGHSIGEYTAAILAGVFSLEDALRMIALRGKLMQTLPKGSMLSVPLPKADLEDILHEHDCRDQLSISAVNSSGLCVAGGQSEAIQALQTTLTAKGIRTTLLHTSHAFHTPMMDPILDTFQREIADIPLNPPTLPYISNITGNWITVEQATDPQYWGDHIRRPVNFSAGLEQLLHQDFPNALFVEIGPGNVLSTFIRKHRRNTTGAAIINLIRHPKETTPEQRYLMDKCGQLWLHGCPIDWRQFNGGRGFSRVPLPTYPFKKQQFPLELSTSTAKPAQPEKKKKGKLEDWFYIPCWNSSFTVNKQSELISNPQKWLILSDQSPLAERLAARLKENNHTVTVAIIGTTFSKTGPSEYTINPAEAGDYIQLFKELEAEGNGPDNILHLWLLSLPLAGSSDDTGWDWETNVQQALTLGFDSLINVAKATVEPAVSDSRRPVALNVVTQQLHAVTGDEWVQPHQATVLGAVKVIPLELPHIRCRNIDILAPEPHSRQEALLTDKLLEEFFDPPLGNVAAYRGTRRWIQDFKPVELKPAAEGELPLKAGGVYVITGGLGGMGLTFAHMLAQRTKGKLALLGRSPFPPPEEWDGILTKEPVDPGMAQKIAKLKTIQDLGAEITIQSADISDANQMRAVLGTITRTFGQINGVIHAAGVADYAGLVRKRTAEANALVLAPKIKGTINLYKLLEKENLDFIALCSSIFSILAPFGQSGYCAANGFLDSFAHYGAGIRHRQPEPASLPHVLTINWDAWQDVGMAVESIKRIKGDPSFALRNAISPAEGAGILERALTYGFTQVAVSTLDFNVLEAQKQNHQAAQATANPEAGPKAGSAPTGGQTAATEMQETLSRIWRDYLGIERINVHDNFFDIGASSLDIVNVNSQIKKELNRDVPVEIMFEHPSVLLLASYLSAGEQAEVPKEKLDKSVNRMEKSLTRIKSFRN
jgi:acyl transferase domain-containing protein